MLKLIVGTKGSGKTKTMIEMIDKATKTTSGNIVVIEKIKETPAKYPRKAGSPSKEPLK